MIRNMIKVAQEAGVKVGICGQASSDYPEFAAFLVQERSIRFRSIWMASQNKTGIAAEEQKRRLAPVS